MAANATHTQITASTAAVANRFVTSTNMKVGAYAIANAAPAWEGGCRVTATCTTATGADTVGTLTVTGTDMAGNTISETLTLVAGGVATSTRVFATVTGATGAGWVINGGNDTITVGCEAGSIVCGSSGTLYGVVVNATAAATITIADSTHSISVFKASFPEGSVQFGTQGVDFTGWLRVTTSSTNDITIIHSPTHPSGA